MKSSSEEEGGRRKPEQLILDLSSGVVSEADEVGTSMFDVAWKMFQEGGHRLIINIIEGEHPEGITEEKVILARMAEQMEKGTLYQHNGSWIYKGD